MKKILDQKEKVVPLLNSVLKMKIVCLFMFGTVYHAGQFILCTAYKDYTRPQTSERFGKAYRWKLKAQTAFSILYYQIKEVDLNRML